MIGDNGFENTSWFLGYVEDNTDRNGRVRVRAMGFHPPASEKTVLTEDLPWAHVVRNSKFVAPLDNGDMVVGFFADGRDAQYPIVIGTINSARYSLPTSGFGGGAADSGMTTTVPPGGNISQQEAYDLALQAGFTPDEAKTMAAIAVAESGLNSSSYNGTPPDNSYGLWQINMINALGPERRAQFGITSNEALFDPLTNAKAAYKIYKQQGFSAWSTYSNGAYTQYVNNISGGGAPNGPNAYENPYLAPSQDAINNFGQPALPPQVTGEDLEYTPILTQAASRREVQFTSAAYSTSEPSPPTGGSVSRTAVWHTRYGGSNITMSGKDTADEYIDITHASGSRITLDGNGNITIKAMGRVFIGSDEGDIEEDAGGAKISNYKGGYAVSVAGGKTQIFSTGDIELNTGHDLILNAGAKIVLNAGDIIGMSGTGVSLTAEVDSINLVSAGKIALNSKSVGLSLDSTEGLYLNAGKKISLKSGDDFAIQSSGDIGLGSSGTLKVKGSSIHLNSPGMDPVRPDAPLTAVTAPVGKKVSLAVAGETRQSKTPTDISPSMTDDVV